MMKKGSDKLINIWERVKGVKKEDWLIVNCNRDYIKEYRNIYTSTAPQYVLNHMGNSMGHSQKIQIALYAPNIANVCIDSYQEGEM